ncbi:MAG: hypothetical protein CMM02_20910 [Rhodopirellula sp.]|nr:hypothetical protein [Rhodopirellula sp.]|tara:strand:+ start:2646 stop:3110 length:465 start_codon:yes stop_codon:yes gene_type:complete
MSILNHLSNLYNIPDDIINKIENYIIFPQNKNLLDDIKNFKIMKDNIYNKYLTNGFEYSDNYTDDFNIYAWIENDLLAYYNNNIAYIDDITNDNIEKLLRQLSFKIKKEKKGHIYALANFHFNMNINKKSRINRYIGNLTTNERIKFIELEISN